MLTCCLLHQTPDGTCCKVIETVNPATFEGIVVLLGRQGFALAERQVSVGVQRQQASADGTPHHCRHSHLQADHVTADEHATMMTMGWRLWLQEWNSWFVRSGFRPSAAPGSGRDDTKSA
jgi:hypothetical protein